MSRRFGRNQKRRMRAELAEKQSCIAAKQDRIDALEEAMRMDRGLLAHQSQKLQTLRDQLDDIASEVAHQSALLGVDTHLTDGFDGMRIVPMPLELLSLQSFLNLADEKTTDRITVETIRLLNVKAVRDRFNGQLHCYVDLAGEGSAYGITESAIRNMSLESLTMRIAPEIARHLLEKLKNVYR